MARLQPDVWLKNLLQPALAELTGNPDCKFYPQIEVAENQKLDLPCAVYVAGNDEQLTTFRASYRDSLMFLVDFRAFDYKTATEMMTECLRLLRKTRQAGKMQGSASRVRGDPQTEFQPAMPISSTGADPVYVRTLSCEIRY